MGLLSWLRGDRTGGADTSRSGDVSRSSEPSRSGDAPPRATPAWRELPPVQRTLSAPALVTDPGRFEDR